MPRPLVFGNGRLLVQLDNKGRIRDFFWPEVGIRNHVAGHYHHLGVYVDGKFSWTEWKEWEVSQQYLPKTMIGVTTFECASLGLVIECRDEVVGFKSNHDAFIRMIKISNLTARPRQVELFFSQDFRIAESEIGDTAFYRADINAMIHFKWNYYFICSAKSAMGGIHQKTVGLRGINGLEGTWRDAEDGHLHGKPIEQGAVDSTFSILIALEPNGAELAEYRIDCLKDLASLDHLLHTDPRHVSLVKVPVAELPAQISDLADRSARILLTQIGSRGEILAANDSDVMKSNRSTYSYVWPRDGALVAAVLDRIFYSQVASQYHLYAARLLRPEQPYFLQKYNIDGTFGATWHPWVFDGVAETPIQEDETALSLWSLQCHQKHSGNPGWNGPYRNLVVDAAKFLESFVDNSTGLPLPSYDLWEESRGVHTFTVATVIGGLRAASELLSEDHSEEAEAFCVAADRIQDALLNHLVDKKTGRFLRGLKSISRKRLEPDYTPDASLLLVGRFAGLPSDHPVVQATNEWVEKELWVHSPIGGLARYPNDYYARVSDQYPGNPWVITTMWLAQEKIRGAKTRRDLNEPLKLLRWVCDRAETTGVLGEQFHPETGEVMTVSPLTWSHAEFIAACLDWCEKWRELS